MALTFLLSVVACADEPIRRSSEALTTPEQVLEIKPKTEDAETDTRRVEGEVIENAHIGRIRYMSIGFSTMEGDFCNLFVSVESGFISAHDGTWSGYDCPWPRDGRHVPLDRDAVRAITDAVNDDAASLRVSSGSMKPGSPTEAKATLTTDRDDYEMSAHIEDVLRAEANRLLEKWLSRDVAPALPNLLTVAVVDGSLVRAQLEAHGVLVMTITDPSGATNRLWVLGEEDLAEIRELTQVHLPTDWIEGDGDRDEYIVRFNDIQTRYWALSAPAAVHRLLELTALREIRRP